jgi:hypothetical protein
MEKRAEVRTGAGRRLAVWAGLAGLGLLAAVSGCTSMVRPSPNPYYAPSTRHKLNVGLYVSPLGRLAYHDYQAGLFNTYRVQYGDALVRGTELAFGGMFEKVMWLESLPQAAASEVDLVINPEMAGFHISSAMVADCNVHCRVTSATGDLLYDKGMAGTGTSGMMGVMLVGSLAYEPALRRTSEEAITSALLLQVSQMEKDIDFSSCENH